MHLKSSRKIVTILLLLGICHSVYLIRPSALLKRSSLRQRLLSLPAAAYNGTMRLKRQLFREDIPHHRPLTGNTYYLHAGFPHPSRWHEGPQTIHPNPNPITHHHLEHHRKPGLHDDLHNNHLNQHDHHHHNHQHNHNHNHHHHNHHLHQNELHEPPPPKVQLVHTEQPHTVNIQSAIVHGGGGGVSDIGSLVDNYLGQHHPSPSPYPHHFTPIHHPSPHPGGHVRDNILKSKPRPPPKPHSEPDHYEEDDEHGLFGLRDHHHGPPPPYGSPSPPPPPKSIPLDIIPHNQPSRKPKTIIHYHPVTVGNIINFNDDGSGHKPASYGPPKHVPGEPYGLPKPLLGGGDPGSYGPPKHVPGEPLAHPHPHHPHTLSMAEPFIKTPFKHVDGPPDYLDFGKDVHQYGPPNHAPGHPLSALDLSPMLPSYGPPVKEEPHPPPYSVALPVLAHLHSTDHHHHHHHHSPPRPPPRKHRKHRGRHHHHHPPRRNHLHFHHIHHGGPPPPGGLGSPFFDIQPQHHPPPPPTYVVHGHVPSKFVSLHSPHFKRHAVSHHHHKTFWAL